MTDAKLPSMMELQGLMPTKEELDKMTDGEGDIAVREGMKAMVDQHNARCAERGSSVGAALPPIVVSTFEGKRVKHEEAFPRYPAHKGDGCAYCGEPDCLGYGANTGDGAYFSCGYCLRGFCKPATKAMGDEAMENTCKDCDIGQKLQSCCSDCFAFLHTQKGCTF